MNFKDMLNKMSQLSEATEKTKTGVKHTADAGGYGRKDDEDDEGKKVKSTDAKKKRGGQEKDEGPKFDVPKGDLFGRTSGKVPAGKKGTEYSKMKAGDKAEKAAEKAEKKKSSLKDWIEHMDAMIAESQIEIKPATQTQSQVIQKDGKTLGTVNNPQLAAQIKQSIGKGEMTLNPNGEEMAEGQDEGKPGKNFAKIAKSAAERYGSKAAGERVAGAVRAKLMKQGKIEEADLPVHDGDMGAGLGAGRNQGTFESAKPDFLDMDKDGNKKESMKKAVADKKKTKVKEGMEHKLKAAHHAGKAHALSKQGYNCNYDDMEEARMYHEGYKQGLDECYGQAPIQGYVGEETPNDVVDNMASYGAYDDVDEGNAFTGALNRTPAGGQFKVGGKTFTDRSSLEEDPVFESWDNQLNSLIEEYGTIQEGLNVSISKGQQGAPDSVSVTAQDAEADQLLQFIKQSGLGLFGGDEQPGQSSPMSLQPTDGGEEAQAEIGVVGDHDGMMDLIKKVTGASAGQPSGGEITVGVDGEEGHEEHGDHEEGQDDYKDEGDSDKEETTEETCNECGMMETDCGCSHDDDKEQVEEVESEDQMTYQMAEDNPPDSGAEEFQAMDQEVAQDNAAASSHGGAQNSNLEEEDELEESYANGADDTFESDIEFMTNVISGGLNGKKTTGQSTIPVVSSQASRLHSGSTTDVSESITDWKALAGIK